MVNPEDSVFGKPQDAHRDGTVNREVVSSGEDEARVNQGHKEASRSEGLMISPLHEFELGISRYDLERSLLHNHDITSIRFPFNSSLLELDLFKPTVDGSEYVRDAFGGFGPGSPEYDDSEPRLTITIPDSTAAIGWFNDTEPEKNGIFRSLPVKKSFAVNISAAKHPGVSTVEVEFVKNLEASLVSGKVVAHNNALNVAGTPEKNAKGIRIDTRTPAENMLVEHMVARLEGLYGDGVKYFKDTKSAVITTDNGIDIYVHFSRLPGLEVTPNGIANFSGPIRYGSSARAKQLELELLALQQHFPSIAEAYADFFRKQLPKINIDVDYNSGNTESKDAVNPERMATLRQELLTDPKDVDFKYIGGLDSEIAKLKQAAMGFSHPEAFRAFGVTPPRGILMQGPPGVGKTSLAMAFARDAEAVVLTLKASTIKNAFHGETERNIRGAFQLADELIEEGERVVIFIDEIEAFAPARDSFGSSTIDRNVTTELLQGMNVDRKNCVIIAATNVPGMVDPALLNNSSRFSEQIEIGLPGAEARTDIINKLFQKFVDMSTDRSYQDLFDSSIDIEFLVSASQGLSGADIENAIRKVLFAKAVTLATTGKRPEPATQGEIYQSLTMLAIEKEKTSRSYL